MEVSDTKAASPASPPSLGLVMGLLFLLPLAAPLMAGVPLNFQVTPFDATGTPWPGNCGVKGFPVSGMCSIGPGGIPPEADPDTTPFYHGFVTIDGVGYWHTIVGDPANGFAMESYVTRTGPGGTYPSNSGGKNSRFFGADADLEQFSGNGWDPLGSDPTRNNPHYTGNGTADLTQVIVRQVMGGTWNETTKTWSCSGAAYCSEFLKAELAFKPVITQEINDLNAGMSALFQIDMSAIDYATDTVTAGLINTVTIDSAPVGNFDMATNVQAGHSSVSGGRYIYTPCANPTFPWNNCWQDADISDGTWQYDTGTYSYADGGFNVLDQDWASYLILNQNPWGSGNEAKCSSGLITSSCP